MDRFRLQERMEVSAGNLEPIVEEVVANKQILVTIEMLFRQHPWHGVITMEEAIADAISYRAGLSDGDRQLYDQQIVNGVHPTSAMQTVEIISGRDRPKGSKTEAERNEPVVVK